MPEVDKSIALPFSHGELSLFKRYQLGKTLKVEGYTQAIVLTNSFKSALIPFFANVPKRTGFLGEMRFGLINDRIKKDKSLYRTVDQFLALAPKNKHVKTVAGSADPYYRDVTLVYDGSQTTRTLDQWKVNGFGGSAKNFMLGTESSVGAKIEQLKAVTDISNERRLTVKVKNIGGNYITYQSRPNDLILSFPVSADLSGYIYGETVTQNIPAGTTVASPNPNQTAGISYGYDINTTGIVISRQSNKLVVRTQRNSFVSGSVKVIGSRSGASAAPSGVAPRYGEYAWVYNPTVNSFVNEGGTYDLFRIAEVGSPYFDLNETPAYTGLTILSLGTSVSGSVGGIDVTSAALTQNSFSNGDFVQQGSSGDAFGNYASGTVYHWEFINSSSGRLYLTDVFGNFTNVSQNGIAGSTLGSYIVTSTTSPDIDPTSGEIIYINNIRPISRVKGQSEEFRLRLGF